MKFNHFAAATIVIAASFPVHAGGMQTGQVVRVLVRSSDGLNAVFLNNTASGHAVCGANQPYWIIRDENSNTGKKQLAILIAAKVSGQTISVTGAGTCARWPDGEDLEEVSLVGG